MNAEIFQICQQSTPDDVSGGFRKVPLCQSRDAEPSVVPSNESRNIPSLSINHKLPRVARKVFVNAVVNVING